MEWFYYFEKFLSIPRESGNEKEISDYLVSFAINNNLEYYRDDFNNVIIKRNSNNGSNDTIILQGHIDMVCTSNRPFDFKNDKIEWFIEDGFYKANGTTLGADNGVGCSIILAILGNTDLLVPNIEAIFTVQEETTMNGAKKLDYSKITGNKLISIDGTDEGVIEVSSAGMVGINISSDSNLEDNVYDTYKIVVDGLLGGHSGTDIDKNRGNAIKILSDILFSIDDVRIAKFEGGSKDNVIPNSSMCIISTPTKINVNNFSYPQFPTLKISVVPIEKCAKVISKEKTAQIIKFMHNLPTEVLSYIDSYPQTSLNLAVVNINDKVININISIRSSNKDDEKKYVELVKKLSEGLNFKIKSSIPFFSFNENSEIRNLLVSKYKELYNKDVKLNHVHAGLEGGVFSEHIPDIDICVIAPNLYDIHTINEKAEIESANRVYKWLVEVLKEI